MPKHSLIKAVADSSRIYRGDLQKLDPATLHIVGGGATSSALPQFMKSLLDLESQTRISLARFS